jgi:hypothetical protein
MTSPRSDALAARLAPTASQVRSRVGLQLARLSERGVDLEGALRRCGWGLGGDGLWREGRVASRVAGLPLVEALGALWIREAARVGGAGAGWDGSLRLCKTPDPSARALSVALLGRRCADLAGLEDCGPVAGEELAELAGALLCALSLSCPRSIRGGAGLRARRSLDALARAGLPPAPRERAEPPSADEIALARPYMHTFGTGAE